LNLRARKITIAETAGPASPKEAIMSRHGISTVMLLALPLLVRPVLAQFRPEEIAERPAMEVFLRTAEIVKSEPVGEGVTHPFRLTLKKDGREAKAFWKNPSGMMYGFLEGWQYEIAAYRLDALMGLNMIPVAVERDFKGKKGALSLWAENKYSLLKVMEQRIAIPQEYQERVEKGKWLTRAWDSLIANEDRTQQNVLYTEDWRTILIDHSRAFRSTKEFTERLMFGANGIKKTEQGNPLLFRRLPRWFVEKLKGLSFESIRAAVGETLTDREIRSVLARRDLLLTEIDGMIRAQGEAAVLYD
jgi:hypothetical protein